LASFWLTAFLPLCLGYSLVLLYQFRTVRIKRLDDARVQARLLGNACRGALESGRAETAARILSAAGEIPWALDAVLVRPDGGIFAAYHRDDVSPGSVFQPGEERDFEFRGPEVLVSHPLERGGRVLGRLNLRASLRGLTPGIVPYSITMLLVLGGLVVLAAALAKIFQERITRPVYGLLAATRNLSGSGGEGGRKKGRDEYSILRERLDYLKEQVDIRAMNLEEAETAKKQLRELEEERGRFREYFENSALGLMIFDPVEEGEDFKFSHFNAAGEKMTRIHRADLIGNRITALFPAVVESGLFAALRRVYQTGEESYHPYSQYHGGREEPWWEHVIWKMSGGTVVAAFRNVTVRKREEEQAAAERERERLEFERRAREEKELAKRGRREGLLGRELEGLFAAVSDELTAPLQSIDEYSMNLLKDYSASLDDKGKNDLIQLRAARHRLLQMLNEIKRLAEVSRTPLKQEAVDLSALAGRKTMELREENPERNPDFKIEEGLSVTGDRQLLAMAIDHLITNAWIFSGKKNKPRIEFGAREGEERREFYVSDNGLGFDMSEAERIFRPFQKLNSDEIYPGTGMGLAIVRRIVLLHGGTIRAESKPGKGTTFFFTIAEPEAEPSNPPAV
jgi:signal transduction histidine kinase